MAAWFLLVTQKYTSSLSRQKCDMDKLIRSNQCTIHRFSVRGSHWRWSSLYERNNIVLLRKKSTVSIWYDLNNDSPIVLTCMRGEIKSSQLITVKSTSSLRKIHGQSANSYKIKMCIHQVTNSPIICHILLLTTVLTAVKTKTFDLW